MTKQRKRTTNAQLFKLYEYMTDKTTEDFIGLTQEQVAEKASIAIGDGEYSQHAVIECAGHFGIILGVRSRSRSASERLLDIEKRLSKLENLVAIKELEE